MHLKRIYYAIMFILLVVSTILSVVDHRIAGPVDYSVLVIFAIDTFYHLYKSDNKWQYIRTHPLDFISLIPFGYGFRAFRFVPLVIRFLRLTTMGKRYILPATAELQKTGMGRFFWYFTIIFFILPLPMYWLEPAIKNYSDLLWWSLQTVTTVGYGDIPIVSNISRMIAAVLMFLGIGMISTFTSSVTKLMTSPKNPFTEAKHFVAKELDLGGKQKKQDTKQQVETKQAETKTTTITIDVADLDRLEKLIQNERIRIQKNK